jgi:hypothetical protein
MCFPPWPIKPLVLLRVRQDSVVGPELCLMRTDEPMRTYAISHPRQCVWQNTVCQMRRPLILSCVAFAAFVGAGAAPPGRSVKDLTFLTRDGCAQTPVMHANLDRALKALKWATDYRVVDIGALPATDARAGYSTPTLLYKDRDVFGLPAPKPPYHEPT